MAAMTMSFAVDPPTLLDGLESDTRMRFVIDAGKRAIVEIAHRLRDMGATVLRGGAFKPRSSPYSFQGLEEEGLKILAEARAETGLPVITEVMDTRQVQRSVEAAAIGRRVAETEYDLVDLLGGNR